jgi:hypothetical protein
MPYHTLHIPCHTLTNSINYCRCTGYTAFCITFASVHSPPPRWKIRLLWSTVMVLIRKGAFSCVSTTLIGDIETSLSTSISCGADDNPACHWRWLVPTGPALMVTNCAFWASTGLKKSNPNVSSAAQLVEILKRQLPIKVTA